MKTKIAVFLCLFTYTNVLFAHGMNKPGPHNGFIKMPGAFHTELIDKGVEIHIYLLDMSFKNPLVINSTVTIIYKGVKNNEYACSKKSEFFVCEKPSVELKNYKEIVVNAVRNNNKAKDAIYSLPLKLDK